MGEEHPGPDPITTEKPKAQFVAENASINNGIVAESTAVAVRPDGTKLHPQPTSDVLDPLNWSALRKNTILGIVMFKYA